jgi:protein-tyrosine phosphatase
MVDIHCHILPGLDDGARTMEESFEMLKLAVANGCTDLVATPHSSSRFVFNEARVTEAFHELSALSRGLINLHRGCDCHLNFKNLEDALAYPAKYSINRSRYLLVELPDLLSVTAVRAQLQALLNARTVPILTHPERNFTLQTNTHQISKWVALGCLIQVTGQSFLGRFGSAVKDSTDALMNGDLVHFVASDAHDCVHRPPNLAEAYEYVRDRWGDARARALFVDNPAAVVNDAPVVRTARRNRMLKFFSFGAK